MKPKLNERQKRIIVDTAGISLTLIACVVYLFIGVVWGLWHPYWIIIASIIGLSAAAKILVEANIKINKIAYEEELKRIREQEEKEANKIKLLQAPKQVEVKTESKPTTKNVKLEDTATINVEKLIEDKKTEIRKRTLGVDINTIKTSSIKEQTLRVAKPKTTVVSIKEVKVEPVKKVASKTITKTISVNANPVEKVATKTTPKTVNKPKTIKTTAKKASTTTKTSIKTSGSSTKKVIKK